jgi:hypothetical protein
LNDGTASSTDLAVVSTATHTLHLICNVFARVENCQRLFTWYQLERLTCGNPVIDVALLERITQYSGCRRSDQHIEFFWQAVNEFSDEERAALIKFAWARSRLPLTPEGFSQPFKIMNFYKTPADSYYPVSHTCFFSLELPKYSSYEIMRDKLRYAIFNCQEIDDDRNAHDSASLGWEDF